MQNDKIVLYMHAGSGNHGCEAIANTVLKLLPKPAILVTNSAAEDETYSLRGMCRVVQERKMEKHFWAHVFYYLKRKIFRDPECFLRYRFRDVTGKNLRKMNISIGGDNYCYDLLVKDLILANRMFTGQGAKTVLLGCSIEPKLLQKPEIVEDMRRYDAIIARESITWQALTDAGLKANTYLYPDPAFLLETEDTPLPEGFEEGNTLGLNVSPMVTERESRKGITLDNYKALIRDCLDNTDMKVALIPHVVWKNNDDRRPLNELYQAFKDTGRVLLLEDAGCMRLKRYIAACRFFIGARTHSTIAAYSSMVPTLVVGYSVKAKGIAQDLFGTSEHYVLPVQSLQKSGELIQAFRWLIEHEVEIREQLGKVMPAYLERAKHTAQLLASLDT